MMSMSKESESPIEIIGVVKKYSKVMTIYEAERLSLCYLMGVIRKEESYILDFYDILKKRSVLSKEAVDTIMKERREGRTGAEAVIMETLSRDAKDPTARKLIEFAMTYAMEVERHPYEKTT